MTGVCNTDKIASIPSTPWITHERSTADMSLPHPASLVASLALAVDLISAMALAIPAHASHLLGAVDDLEEIGDMLIIDAEYEPEVAMTG